MWGLINDLQIVTKGNLGKVLWSLPNKPIVLLTLLSIILKCPWKSNLVSKNIPKCFWVTDWVTVSLLELNLGWVDFWSLRVKITSRVYLLGSGLKVIFHWKAQLFSLFKSWFNLLADKCLSFITEKSDVSFANSLGFEIKLPGKSFIYIKKSSGPRNEPWGTPASIFAHFEWWPFKTTFCLLLFRKLAKVSS